MKQKLETVPAFFFQRCIAFIIDVFLVSVAVSIISIPFVDNDAVSKLSQDANEVVDQYVSQKIDEKTYFSETMNISYQLARKNGIVTLISLFLEILYFVVYQFYHNGQTIGKKLMKIQVISTTDSALTMNQMIFRSFIINSILVEMILFGFTIFSPKEIYYYGDIFFEGLQFIIMLVCIIMVMFSKEGLGLHDRLTHTRVIQGQAVKEAELCEN